VRVITIAVEVLLSGSGALERSLPDLTQVGVAVAGSGEGRATTGVRLVLFFPLTILTEGSNGRVQSQTEP